MANIVTPFGFLNINKPKGITSFDVIYKLRKNLGMKKIGHAGTLDPLATGVLPIALGGATKLIEYLRDDKKYIGTVKFGEISTTYDEEGVKTFISKPNFTRKELEEALLKFSGKISQIPPIYSAVKINGKKLYQLARAGKTINEMPKIKEREIEIYEIKILDFNLPLVKIKVHCSSGTYIRTLAHDIGQKMGCGGYLSDLERIQAGEFEIENAIGIENSKEKLLQNLINPVKALSFKQHELSESEFLKVKNGNSIAIKEKLNEGEKILLIYNSALISVATCKDAVLKVDKVLNIC